MSIMEDLRNLRLYHRKLDREMKQLADLRSRATSIGGMDYSKDRVQTSPSPDAPYVRTVNRMVDLEKQVELDSEVFVEAWKQADETLSALLADHRGEQEVLRLRYLHDKSWEEIAGRMHVSRTTVWRLHRNGVNRISSGTEQ